MRLEPGDKVRYLGGEPIQLTYRGHPDPTGILTIGEVYTLSKVHQDAWYTDLWVEDVNHPDTYRGFNSVVFEFVADSFGDGPGLTINSLVTQSLAIAKEHGFWDDAFEVPMKYIISSKLALIHSEVTEALDEVRDARELAKLCEVRYTETGKPEGFGSELADAVIRIADLAGHVGIDLEAAIIEKAAYNRGRPFMHGRTI